MGLPHYNQSRASVSKFEPVTQSLFEVTVFVPDALTGSNVADSGLILEHVKSIGGLGAINPSLEHIGQKYKFADRSFAGVPGETAIDLTVTLTMNLNDANEAYIYNTFRKWRDLEYNPATGEMGLKKDYCGSIVLVQFNRKGDIYRKLVFQDVFIKGDLGAWDELNWDSQEPVELSVVFRCDRWTEDSKGLNA